MDSVYLVKSTTDEGSIEPDAVLVENLAKTSKTNVKKITKKVECSLVYPVLRGRDVKRWYSNPKLQIIVPHHENGIVIDLTEMKTNYPKAYDFLNSFKGILAARTIKPFLGEKKKVLPFYILDNIGLRTFSKYKVVWKHISGKISGRGLLEVAVVSPSKNERTIIPTHGLMFIPSNDFFEAHFLCGVLNSSIAHLIVMTYSLEVHITTDVPKYVYLPKFNKNDQTHKLISDLSIEAHEISKKLFDQDNSSIEIELEKITAEIDKAVCQMYNISPDELKEIRKSIKIFKEGSS